MNDLLSILQSELSHKIEKYNDLISRAKESSIIHYETPLARLEGGIDVIIMVMRLLILKKIVKETQKSL
jgi:hypothetical protein